MPFPGEWDDTVIIMSQGLISEMHSVQNGKNYVKTFTYTGDTPDKIPPNIDVVVSEINKGNKVNLPKPNGVMKFIGKVLERIKQHAI